MSFTMISYVCEFEPCRAAFTRRKGGNRRRYRFCSLRCADLSRRKITEELLRPYAERGSLNYEISAALNISKTAVLPALRRFGLYRLWCERRYKKCASLTVGSESVITPAGTAIGRSVAST